MHLQVKILFLGQSPIDIPDTLKENEMRPGRERSGLDSVDAESAHLRAKCNLQAAIPKVFRGCNLALLFNNGKRSRIRNCERIGKEKGQENQGEEMDGTRDLT